MPSPSNVALEVFHDRVLGNLGRRLLKTSTQDPINQSALYSPRNDPDLEMIPNPEMIPKSTLK